MIIELPHGLIKFKSISLKYYFINNQEHILDSFISTQVPLAKAPPTETAPTETPQIKISLADITPIKYAAKSPLATLASLSLVKQSCRQPKKYPE